MLYTGNKLLGKVNKIIFFPAANDFFVSVCSCNNIFHFFSGAFGYLEITHDISKYCKANVFSEIGKKTPLAIRFSTVGELFQQFTL